MSRSGGISKGLVRAAVLAVTLPLVGGVLVAAAPAAGAAVTAPGNGTTYTGYSTITISADYGRSTSENRLTLTSPGGSPVTVATAPAGLNSGTLTYRLDTGCWTYPSCSGRRLAPNGTWTVSQSGGGSGTSTFVTRIRPEAPTSVSATPISTREVRVSWRLGDEPDLTGWEIVEGGSVVKDGIGRSACEGTTCSAVVGYSADGTGEHSYAVRAFRLTGPGSSTTLDSPLSATAGARLDAPPQEPAAEPASGGETGGSTGESAGGGTTSGSGSSGGSSSSGSTGGTGGTGGGSTGGGTASSSGSTGGGASGGAPMQTGTSSGGGSAAAKAIAQRKAFALGFSSFGPKLGIPKLPPLPQSQAPAIAPELADGTYEPTLGFQDQVLTERVEVAQGPTQKVAGVVGSALDSERLLRSTAAALVLLLAGAHLRRWLGAAHEER